MCGICGIFAPGHEAGDLQSRVQKMCDAMIHRGPDDEGIYAEEGFAMGARRLSIVDLNNGHQPFVTPDNAAIGIMNGEIYNYKELREKEKKKGYRFLSECDTEAMLAHIHNNGIDSVASLNGIFTIAYWNRKNKSLFLARDHVGIKPLYVYAKNSIVAFASELKALLASDMIEKELSYPDISAFLSLAYIPGHKSPFKDVTMLPPGTFMSISNERKNLRRYWKIGEIKQEEISSPEDSIRTLIRECVHRQLTGDVPIGVLLSAGLDSSIVLKKMVEIYKGQIHTFTARFEDENYDEGKIAGLTSGEYATIHHEINCRPKDIKDNFNKIVHATDGLIANTAAFPIYMVSKLAGEYLKVVMTGIGGDELFFGYPTYQADQLAKFFRKLPLGILGLLKNSANLIPTSHRKVSFEYKLKKFFEGACLTPEKAHFWWRTIITDNELSNLMHKDVLLYGNNAWHAFEEAFKQSSAEDFLQQTAVCDFETWLACMALPMNDNCSMAHSLEMRVPLLDIRLVERVFSIPRPQRFIWKTKKLMRKAVRKDLSSLLLKQPKRGFHIPLASWLCGDLKDFMLDRLSPASLATLDFITPAPVQQLITDHLKKRVDNNYRIWNLLVLSEWCHQFIGI